jgi:hypothetical protein
MRALLRFCSSALLLCLLLTCMSAVPAAVLLQLW